MKTGGISREDLQLRRRDGGKIDISVRVTAVRDANGEHLYLI